VLLTSLPYSFMSWPVSGVPPPLLSGLGAGGVAARREDKQRIFIAGNIYIACRCHATAILRHSTDQAG
jgi:hypothetical protein